MNCRQADIIGYSIFLEIFLEMLFSIAFGVPEKSVFTRLFCVFATVMLANFQDRLVMTTLITLRTEELYHMRGVLSSPKRKKVEKSQKKKRQRNHAVIIRFSTFLVTDSPL